MTRNSLPAADEVFGAQPAARPEDPELRASIRARRESGRLALGVVDDDPTGSQAVHGVQVVLTADAAACAEALAGPAATCFALTNSRSVPEPVAVRLTTGAGRGLAAGAGRTGRRIQLLSRGDSTLRGHVAAEAGAAAARPQAGNRTKPNAPPFSPPLLQDRP
ncbi:MAG: four-carbon acid sugar kinase family protein, partial [Streptosporangiaceae bacterium]